MATPLRVLVLEDNPSDAELALHELRRAGFEPLARRVETEEEYLRCLEEAPELIISDHTLPDLDAPRAQSLLEERGLDIPFIVVSGTISEDVAVECMKRGAADYLLKDRLARLGQAVRHALDLKQVRDEMHRAVDALRESESLYRTLVEAIDDAITVKDVECRYVAANAAFAGRVGLHREEIVGRTPSELFGEERGRRIMERDSIVLSRGEVVDTEEDYPLWRNGEVRHVRKAPMRDDHGQVVGVVTVSRDVTERKAMDERLLRAQRLETAGRIAGQVAHDFNNLLVPLAAYPELIKMRLPAGDPLVPFCDSMMESVRQMVHINSELLTLGRRGRFCPEPTDLNQVVQQALAKMPPIPDSLKRDLELGADLLPVGGSAVQLLRVVYNLASNARDAMQDAGLLRVSTENVYVDQPFGRYARVELGEYVRLRVTDSGCGIPPEIRDQVFDPYFSTKKADSRRGSGLGLSIVQAVVDDHRGYVDFQSEVGKGTTFSVYLPVWREAAAKAPVSQAKGGDEAVLVVDDDPRQREVLEEMLRILGYRTQAAESGERAIEHLGQHTVDLLILDMAMPPGIDGVETYRRAQRVKPGQRAIIVSGFARPEQILEVQSLGAGAHVRKPVSLPVLARAVREELDRQWSGREASTTMCHTSLYERPRENPE